MTHPVDKLVGKRIRSLRLRLGYTQKDLADRVGVKFQQIQKYETGMNRVSASRLSDIANVFEISVSHFFDKDEGATQIILDKKTIDLVNNFSKLTSEKQSLVIKLVKDL